MTEAERHRFFSILKSRDHVRAALVFGSVARGDARPDSDLDIAVIATAPLDMDQQMDLMRALSLEFGRPVDLVDLSAHQGAIVRHAFTRGELVYCCDRNAYATRTGQMLRDEADFEPILRHADQQAIKKWLKPQPA